ncbi:cell division protein SepF [Cumulibacter soli]|uniref:cell division protein SepF n=1 Tax=Cumulibacter soli TaxID=2546344 RepID=UPI0010682960|nr:cell division protein SepF [Cumulibacter soli]
MTGAMRKMGVYLGLVEDDAHEADVRDSSPRARAYDRRESDAHADAISEDDRFDYDDADIDDLPPEPRYSAPVSVPERAVPEPRLAAREVPAPAAPQRITTLHPRTYTEARTLGEQFRDGNPVIMNLTEMDDADAKRIVDFAAGLTFALRGSFERITAKVFLLSPQKVKVTAEEKARIADGRYPARG